MVLVKVKLQDDLVTGFITGKNLNLEKQYHSSTIIMSKKELDINSVVRAFGSKANPTKIFNVIDPRELNFISWNNKNQ